MTPWSPGEARLVEIARGAVARVSGRSLVARYLRREGDRLWFGSDSVSLGRRVRVLGAGKASFSMAQGILELVPKASALIVDKEARSDPRIEVLVGGHPMPDERSLAAGDRLLLEASRCGPEDLVLFLLSGGASALMEALRPRMTLEMLRAANEQMLREGWDIERMNAARREFSRVKGGGLGRAFGGAEVRVLVMSDVLDAPLSVVGSGPVETDRFWCLGDWRDLRSAAVLEAEGLSVSVVDQPLRGDVEAALDALFGQLGESDLVLGVGECPVVVRGAGVGGRCQEMAARAALRLMPGLAFCAIASDGTDGPTESAGGVVSFGLGSSPGLAEALERSDSGGWLRGLGRTIEGLARESNLNDLYLLGRV